MQNKPASQKTDNQQMANEPTEEENDDLPF